jgi:hypothetical protein
MLFTDYGGSPGLCEAEEILQGVQIPGILFWGLGVKRSDLYNKQKKSLRSLWRQRFIRALHKEVTEASQC